ncbi:MAG: alpha/beta hydrolase [Anaerolineae bacterium]|nr:alpha/beta hydrolase [Anaerolineae bacterium]
MNNNRHPLGWYVLRIVTALLLLIGAGVVLVYLRYREDMRANEARLALGSKTVDTPCGALEYGEQGEGTPVLAIHGAGGGYDQGLMLAALGDGFRIIAPSRFGYLKTPIPDDPSVAAQAQAYACLLDALGIDRIAVAADSAGGPSALQFALDCPDRVSSLVLVSAISTLRPIRDDSSGPSNELLTDFVYWAAVTYFPDTVLAVLGVPAESLAHVSPAEHEAMVAAVRSFQPMSARLPGMNLDIVEEALPEVEALPISDIQAPTLVIHARDDALVPFAQGQYSADHIPGARLMAVDYGGHLALVLDSVLAEMRTFIREHA